jgi:hypothetical protein
MKYETIGKAIDADEDSKIYHIVQKPFLLGIVFGVGCYIAKVIINSPLMKNIVETTA